MWFLKRGDTSRRRGGFKRAAAASVLGIAVCGQFGAPAGAVTFDELKGYSIEFHNTHTDVWKTSGGPGNPPANEVRGGRRLYVSLAGRIFDYGELSAGAFSGHDSRVVAPDAAASANRGRMIAWTIEGGNLVGVSHEVEGFVVRTVTVDLARMTCTMTLSTKPDPTTGRVVMNKLNGYQDELVSMKPGPSDCAIKRGNVFATDQ